MLVSQIGSPVARGWWCAAALVLLWPSGAQCQSEEASVGGTLALTSDYIYRGVSESDGQGALQVDLHGNTAAGTYGGIWASTRDRNLPPETPGEAQLYLGQRFALAEGWTVSVSGRADYFVGAAPEHSDDYQELSAGLTWLDLLNLSLTAIPNAVRYATYPGGYAPYRGPAFVAEGSGQQLLGGRLLGGALYATAGAGLYHANQSRSGDHTVPTVNYLYGNVGLAFERGRWRLDAGYFVTQRRAAQVFLYPVANQRFAATLSWQF